MKFFFKRIYKTALTMSVEQENIDIIKLLLEHPDIDVNKKSIFNHFVF